MGNAMNSVTVDPTAVSRDTWWWLSVLAISVAVLLLLYILTRPKTKLNGDEHKELILSVHRLDPTGVFLDVGANQAGTSFLAAGKGHRVFTFEAIPENAQLITDNIRLYGFQDRIKLVQGAVWDSAGHSKWFNPQSQTDFDGQLVPSERVTEPNKASGLIAVKTVTIDDHVDEDVLFMKVDVEGCEFRALMGASNLLRTRHVPFLLVEYSPANLRDTSEIANPTDLLTFLSQLGYELYLHTCHWGNTSNFPYSCQQQDARVLTEALWGGDFARAKHIPSDRLQHFTEWVLRSGGNGGYNGVADILCIRSRDLPELAPPRRWTW